jgi:hypothetical protein
MAGSWRLIDAHNCLHAHRRLGSLLRRDPEQAHRALIDAVEPDERTILFFDGGPGGRSGPGLLAGARVEWSGRATADDRIVAWLHGNSAYRPVTVVTDDRDLGLRVRAAGGRVEGVDRFWRRLDRAGRQQAAPEHHEADQHRELPKEEVDHWLRLFCADPSGADDATS